LLAGLGAGIADLGAQSADRFREWRQPAHPGRRQMADIRTLAAQPDAPCHQIHVAGMALMRHADHIVMALAADAGTRLTRGNTILDLLRHFTVVLVHGAPFGSYDDASVH